MTNLLISKVNNIRVIQSGESKLSVENKKQDSSTAKAGGVGDVFPVSNKTQDLGNGKKTYNIKIFVLDRAENDALLNIVHNKRYCTVVDKFKGKLQVYIESFSVTDSDKHIGQTIFELNCAVQDIEIAPTVNFESVARDKVKELEQDLVEKVAVASQRIGPTDPAMDALRSGVQDLVGVQSKVLGYYKRALHKANTLKRLAEALAVIAETPINLAKQLIAATDIAKGDLVPIFRPKFHGLFVDEIAQESISNLERKKIARLYLTTQLLNSAQTISEIKKILEGGYENKADFEAGLERAIERVSHCGYTPQQRESVEYITKGLANTQKFREIHEIHILEYTPLQRIVYELYGSLDSYEEIRALNNFSETDYIKGAVSVYK